MGLGGRHLGLTRQVLERHAPSRACQHLEQLAAEGFAHALDEPAFAAELEAVRTHRLSVVADQLLPGISALATPVFDGFGQLVLCLAAIGPTATLPTGPGSPVARHLRDAAQALSQRLGAPAVED